MKLPSFWLILDLILKLEFQIDFQLLTPMILFPLLSLYPVIATNSELDSAFSGIRRMFHPQAGETLFGDTGEKIHPVTLRFFEEMLKSRQRSDFQFSLPHIS